MEELKAVKVLESCRLALTCLSGTEKKRHQGVDKLINEAIKEIKEYEQNFKQKEFDYRTQCQNVLSAGRIEADNMPDRLAELEKVILDYYLDKGYQIGVGSWDFNVEIESDYKSKSLLVYFREHKHDHYSQVFKVETETTKEMFDKAIEYFSARQNEV